MLGPPVVPLQSPNLHIIANMETPKAPNQVTPEAASSMGDLNDLEDSFISIENGDLSRRLTSTPTPESTNQPQETVIVIHQSSKRRAQHSTTPNTTPELQGHEDSNPSDALKVQQKALLDCTSNAPRQKPSMNETDAIPASTAGDNHDQPKSNFSKTLDECELVDAVTNTYESVSKLPSEVFMALGKARLLPLEIVCSWKSVLDARPRLNGSPPLAGWPNTAPTSPLSLPSLLRRSPLVYEFHAGSLETVSEKDRFKANGSFIPTEKGPYGSVASRHCVRIDGNGQCQMGQQPRESGYWGGLIVQKCCMEKLDSLLKFKNPNDEPAYKIVRNNLLELEKAVKEWKHDLENDIQDDKENDELLNQFNECLIIEYVGHRVEIIWGGIVRNGYLNWAITNFNLSVVKIQLRLPDNFWRPTFEMCKLGNEVEINILEEIPFKDRYPESFV